MIHDISTTEFIRGIINDLYDENDIVKYCYILKNINAFWGALIVEHSRMIGKGNDTIVAFSRELTTDVSDCLSIEDKRKLGRIESAISVVEELMQEMNKNELKKQGLDKTEPLMTREEYAASIIPKWKTIKPHFEKAIEVGLMDSDYQWLKGLQLLACFVRELSIKFDLGKGIGSNGQKRIKWKPFEDFYGLDKGRLRLNYNDIQKTGQSPSEIDLIDKVFE